MVAGPVYIGLQNPAYNMRNNKKPSTFVAGFLFVETEDEIMSIVLLV